MPEVKVTKENGGALARPEMYFPTVPFTGLFGASPFKFMKRFTEEMDRAFTGFAPPSAEFELWAPPLEVRHKNGNFVVTAELPGLTKEEIKVEVMENALVIEGERKRETEEKGEDFYRSERYYGKFYRSIPLPRGATTEQIKAELNNGILEIVIPVPEMKPAARQVPIGAGTK